MVKYSRNIDWLCKERFGSFKCNEKFIINLSSVSLSIVEMELLCRGLDFGLPCKSKCEEVLAEFELFNGRLSRHAPKSSTSVSSCAAQLSSIAYRYSDARVDKKLFSLREEHFKARNELRRNSDIVITRPDKGRATVLLDKSEYVVKVMVILNDSSKFVCLGPVGEYDSTVKIENQLWSFLKELVNVMKCLVLFLIILSLLVRHVRVCMVYQRFIKLMFLFVQFCLCQVLLNIVFLNGFVICYNLFFLYIVVMLLRIVLSLLIF